jgi:hypothetical protein
MICRSSPASPVAKSEGRATWRKGAASRDLVTSLITEGGILAGAEGLELGFAICATVREASKSTYSVELLPRGRTIDW